MLLLAPDGVVGGAPQGEVASTPRPEGGPLGAPRGVIRATEGKCRVGSIMDQIDTMELSSNETCCSTAQTRLERVA
jgi:hypothetical protein